MAVFHRKSILVPYTNEKISRIRSRFMSWFQGGCCPALCLLPLGSLFQSLALHQLVGAGRKKTSVCTRPVTRTTGQMDTTGKTGTEVFELDRNERFLLAVFPVHESATSSSFTISVCKFARTQHMLNTSDISGITSVGIREFNMFKF